MLAEKVASGKKDAVTLKEIRFTAFFMAWKKTEGLGFLK